VSKLKTIKRALEIAGTVIAIALIIIEKLEGGR
jgi:hypothetical protein